MMPHFLTQKIFLSGMIVLEVLASIPFWASVHLCHLEELISQCHAMLQRDPQ